MPAQEQSVPMSKAKLWTAHILKGIAILFLLFDSVIHLMLIAPVVDSFHQLGLPVELAVTLGLIELTCLLLYSIPRTSIFGAILLTGYLGGAIAIQFRIQAPILSTTLFPIYVGILLWGGIFLVDEKLQALIPFRKENEYE